MSEGSLQKAREELRKQFVAVTEAIANRQQHPQSFIETDQIIRLRQAIDALDHAINGHWEREPPHTKLRPPKDDPYMEMHEFPEFPGEERG